MTNIIILLSFTFAIYSIYSLITNIISSNIYRSNLPDQELDNKDNSFEGFLVLSLGSKQLHEKPRDQNYYLIQCWLGVAFIVLWGIIFIWIKYKEMIGEMNLLRETKSAADFSITIENYPVDMSQE